MHTPVGDGADASRSGLSDEGMVQAQDELPTRDESVEEVVILEPLDGLLQPEVDPSSRYEEE